MVNFGLALVVIDVVVAELGDVTIFVGTPSACDDTMGNIVNPLYDNIQFFITAAKFLTQVNTYSKKGM